MKKNKNKLTVVLGVVFPALLLSLSTQISLAAVSQEEAAQLGRELTRFGAEQSANADGSIPAYAGGLEKLDAYDPATMSTYIDPFADEKPIYSVSASNMGEYQEMLTAGTKAMMEKYPSFSIDVYPSHRTFRYPEWVLENTVKNATTTSLTGDIEGDALAGADENGLPFRGIPFPIPKTGYEVLWNQSARFSAAVSHNVAKGFLVDSSGNTIELSGVNSWFLHPWYDENDALRSRTFSSLFGFSATLTSPPSAAGTVFLNYYTADAANEGQRVWFYTPGQRRVRRAPEFAYDVPIAAYGGVTVWDDVYGYLGRMDRFNFELVGKKEMLIPYNAFAPANTLTIDQVLGENHVNPAAVRWEKHRVWVVDGTRKDSARHAYSRRTFYVNEDCWCIVASEAYDNGGQLWRTSSYYSFPTYDTGGFNTDTWSTNDLVKGNYFILNADQASAGNSVRSYSTVDGLPVALTPRAVEASSVR